MEKFFATAMKGAAVIPKTIHYCWFGRGEKPAIFSRCYRSWVEKLPDYQIIEWNEDNFDVRCNEYVSQAYDNKMFAFVSDYARLVALETQGGVYLDTDVEVLKSLDPFLSNSLFMGYESESGIAPGLIMGSVKGHPFLSDMRRFYESNSFIDEHGCMNTYTTVNNATDLLIRQGLVLDSEKQATVGDITIYPKRVFCPSEDERRTGEYSPETYTAHHYSATWRNEAYNRNLKNPMFACFIEACASSGRAVRHLFGDEKWESLRNGPLKRLYDFVRGVN